MSISEVGDLLRSAGAHGTAKVTTGEYLGRRAAQFAISSPLHSDAEMQEIVKRAGYHIVETLVIGERFPLTVVFFNAC